MKDPKGEVREILDKHTVEYQPLQQIKKKWGGK